MGGALFGGRYELQEQLGSGGMARVHRARDTRLGRTVAVKTLHRNLARDPEARMRFAREARAAAVLNHPGIVTVHDQDEVRDGEEILPYLVMEYIDGVTLERVVKERAPLDPGYAVRITCEVLDALAHAHAHGTVHRDVKPSNVMITKSGAVKVADFGIARVVDATTLTVTGFTVGTPGYMAPEQVLGRPVDARGDVYAVGCLLTELLTGSVPFIGDTPLNVMYGHVHQAPPRPSERNPEVPRDLDEIVLGALTKDPQDRPPDAAALRTELRGWLHRAGSGASDLGITVGGITVGGVAERVLPAGERPTDSVEPTDGDRPRGESADPTGEAGSGESTGSGQDTAPDPVASGPSTTDPQAGGTPPAAESSGAAGPPAAEGDPRTGFTFLKGGGPAAVAAVPQATPPLAGFGPPPSLPYPPAGVNPYSGTPQAAWGVANGTPSPSFHPVPPPAPRPRGKLRWVIPGVAVTVVGALVAGLLVLDPFDRDDGSVDTELIGKLTEQRTSASGYNGALEGVVSPSTERGGTLRLASSVALDTLDPADTYDTLSWNLQRVFMRKLVDYAPMPGAKGRVLKPDLATDTGQVSDGGRTYTFTLKEGVRFENGDPITSRDIKYGIERSFATDVFNGPEHLVDLLDQGQDYPGPYQDDDPDRLGLSSVETPDDRTIVFHLQDPFPDFPYVLAMSPASPVPRAADGGETYGRKPVASGPYKLESEVRAGSSSLALVRNDEWDARTDPIRTALPDRIELAIHPGDQDAVDNALLTGAADLDPAQVGLGDAAERQVLGDAEKKAYSDSSYTGALRYLSVQPSVAPLDAFQCRRAVQYAIDKTRLQTLYGGPDTGGDVAGGVIPPTITGYDRESDVYGTLTGPRPNEAGGQLNACGKTKGFTTKLVASASGPRNRELLQVIQADLKVVGIKAEIELVDGAEFFTDIQDPEKVEKRKWGIILTSWSSDWPAPTGFLRPLVDKDSAYNYAQLDAWDIDSAMDEAAQEEDPREARDKWVEVDEKIMNESVIVPLLHGRALNYRGKRLTNAYVHPALGGIDIQALGVVKE